MLTLTRSTGSLTGTGVTPRRCSKPLSGSTITGRRARLGRCEQKQMAAANISLGTMAWADRINASFRRAAAALVQTGILLIEAKTEIQRTNPGGFTNMLENELDFSPQIARVLIQIAQNQ